MYGQESFLLHSYSISHQLLSFACLLNLEFGFFAQTQSFFTPRRFPPTEVAGTAFPDLSLTFPSRIVFPWTMGTISTPYDNNGNTEHLTNGHHNPLTINGIIANATITTLKQNNPSKPWVVQKFGGTSVGKVPEVIAEQIIRQWLDNDKRVVVVCSARSSDTKSAGTTNR